MSDQDKTNPITGEAPHTYEDAYYNDEQAYVLYDTYLMLRDCGFTVEELYPLMVAINQTTIFDGTSPEQARWRSEFERDSRVNWKSGYEDITGDD